MHRLRIRQKLDLRRTHQVSTLQRAISMIKDMFFQKFTITMTRMYIIPQPYCTTTMTQQFDYDTWII